MELFVQRTVLVFQTKAALVDDEDRHQTGQVDPDLGFLSILALLLIAFPPFKVQIAANWKGVCLQNTSKSHSFHLKIWLLL